MSRGILYEAAMAPGDLSRIIPADFAGKLDAMGMNGLTGQEPDDARKSIDRLRVRLLMAGFRVLAYDGASREQDAEDGVRDIEQSATAFVLETERSAYDLDRHKHEYFRERFDRFGNAVLNMNLHAFATDAVSANGLLNLIDDRFSDAVWFDAGTGPAMLTMDGFVRRLGPGRKYYFGASACLMQ